MPPIRGVLFDYGLVLSGPPDPQAWSSMKTQLAADEESFHTAYWRPRHDYDRGTLNGDTYWATVVRELGQIPGPDVIRALQHADVNLWTQPNREMIDWAASLKAKGFRTGILSNLGDAMEEGLRERFDWLAQFDHLTFSHRLGTAKPDPSIYRHAVEGLALPVAEILFIDDREENVAAAQAMGMQAIQYVDHRMFVADLKSLGEPLLPLPATR